MQDTFRQEMWCVMSRVLHWNTGHLMLSALLHRLPCTVLGKALNLSVFKLSSYEMRIIDASCLPPFIHFIYLDGKLLISDHVFMHGLEQ